jgi:hypothetical protein
MRFFLAVLGLALFAEIAANEEQKPPCKINYNLFFALQCCIVVVEWQFIAI